MYSVSTFAASRYSFSFVATNSEPLSRLTCLGAPRTLNTPAIRSRIRSPVIERSTSSSRHSRVYSSTRVRKRSGLPRKSLSSTKSQHHTSFRCIAFLRSIPFDDTPRRRFLRLFRGTRSPSRR